MVNLINKNKTHCPYGHPLIEDNLILSQLKLGKRSCKTCFNQRNQKKRNPNGSVSPALINKLKTHCKRGHEFTPENTRIDKNGKRICKACKRQTQKDIYHNKGGKDYQSNWQRENPDKVSKYNKTWNVKNRKTYSKTWDKINSDSRKTIREKHEHTEKRINYRRDWQNKKYANNPEFRKQKSEYNRQYRIENPQSGASYPDDVALGMMERRMMDKNICQWYDCGMTTKEASIEVNHIFPISKYPEQASNPYNMICYCEYHHAYWHYVRGDHYWKMICPELGELVNPNEKLDGHTIILGVKND